MFQRYGIVRFGSRRGVAGSSQQRSGRKKPAEAGRSSRTWLPAAEKQPICDVVGLFDVVVAEAVEKRAKRGLVVGRHLHADQHPAVIRAVIPVMEQADVPGPA